MTPRQIQTLMNRLFYGDIPMSDGYRHLMVNGELERGLVENLVTSYIIGDKVIVYRDAQHCTCCPVEDAYDVIREYLPHGRVKLAATDFSGRIIVEPIGVGAGTRNDVGVS
jgi:hypothetical protein